MGKASDKYSNKSINSNNKTQEWNTSKDRDYKKDYGRLSKRGNTNSK